MAFLETLLIIILVILGLRILFKFLAPLIIRYALKKVKQKFEKAQNPNANPSRQAFDEETTHNKSKTPKSNPNAKVGEYVDYEELD